MSRWVDVGYTVEIAPDTCKIVLVDNVPLAIFNLNGEFYTIEDNCPHQHLPVADGIVEGNDITCPYHGARFCIKTGEVLSPPACENLRTFATRVSEDGIIQVRME